MKTKSLFSILIITDDRLSRDKAQILNRTLYELKQEFQVEIIRGETAPTEAQILEKLTKSQSDQSPIHLLLVPFRIYCAWHRIEGFWGPNRTGGPTFAGYFSESLPFTKLPDFPHQIRRIILDFCNITIPEQLVLIRTLVWDKLRTGILPLLPPKAPIYFESWYSNQGLGNRFDQIFNLPEIAQTEWIKRASEIQILISALWSLVYVGRLGKSEGVSTGEAAPPKAYLQIGIDPSCLVFRLCFSALPRLFPQNIIELFTPNSEDVTQPGQLMLQFGDFLRVHSLGDTSEIEVVVGLFPSAPSQKAHGQLRTVWLEPIAEHLLSETPYAEPTPNTPHLKTLPAVSRTVPNLKLLESKKQSDQKDAVISHANTKILDLRDKIHERDEKIKELKQGGVGIPSPIEPPDAEALLEGFQERYFDSKYQIRQFELEIIEIEKNGGTAQQIHNLRLKMDALRNREASWIKKLMSTIELLKKN